jgi:hypothetical protein
MNKAHRSEFLSEVKKLFPEIKEDINKQQGLLSFEIDIFIKHVQAKIDSNEPDAIQTAYELLEKYYRMGNTSIQELIRNAVCEDLDFANTKKHQRMWAYELLPQSLKIERKDWLKLMGYNHV